MNYIDMHAHMVSRTTDDYKTMAMTGCVAVTEPAFWAGYDFMTPEVFRNYFNRLTDFEPKRAAKYGVQHFTWICINPKETEDRDLTRQVLEIIPEYLEKPTVLGVGEIGLNRVTRNELEGFVEQVKLALEYNQLIHIHTPHLEDKYKGSKVIVDTLLKIPGVQPNRVMVDHAEEHTIPFILENGFWTGLTLYPTTKASYQRAVDMIERYSGENIIVASACDWGPSQPMAIPNFIQEMRRRGHSAQMIEKIVLENPKAFLSQSPNFNLHEELMPFKLNS
jgi:uncharacterized protein